MRCARSWMPCGPRLSARPRVSKASPPARSPPFWPMSAAPALRDPQPAETGDAFGAAEFQAAVGATDAQMADLERFRVSLADWNERMNLVGPSAMAEFWLRHAFDSAQLLALAPKALIWAD